MAKWRLQPPRDASTSFAQALSSTKAGAAAHQRLQAGQLSQAGRQVVVGLQLQPTERRQAREVGVAGTRLAAELDGQRLQPREIQQLRANAGTKCSLSTAQ